MGLSTRTVLARCGSVANELAPGALGDQRLNERRDRVVAMLERQPDRGFPDACADDAEVEALYRFLRNPRVVPETLLAPHLAATGARCAAVGEVLVLHDTTEMVFGGTASRTGLTRLGPGRHGFWVHVALAVSADGQRAPLGLLSLISYGRAGPPAPRPRPSRARFADPLKESRRWMDGVTAARGHLTHSTPAIHVMDRDADSYELFAALIARHDRFIVRLTHNRRLVTDDGTVRYLSDALSEARVVCDREVPLAPRPDTGRTLSARTCHPARAARRATLQIATQRVHLRRSRYMKTSDAPASLPVHIVWVRERHAPVGATPVEWRLVTTEPIDTPEQILRVVDWYRTRWVIEEYFKALKTGCAYEKRQLESLQTLRVALALLAPLAWRLLRLRHLARDAPDTPATAALSARQLHLLRATPRGARLPPAATVCEALAVIATLGGHLRQNGPPGWLVLARGFQKLQDMELGWLAATSSTCDQS
jgi:Transposase DNA-binding/Transposase DDE domain